MSEWINNTPANAAIEPPFNSKAEVKLHGDEDTYIGTCIKPRKLWIELGNDYPGGAGFIADENSIERWRLVE